MFGFGVCNERVFELLDEVLMVEHACGLYLGGFMLLYIFGQVFLWNR